MPSRFRRSPAGELSQVRKEVEGAGGREVGETEPDGTQESQEALEVVRVSQEGVGRTAAGAQVAQERGDGQDYRAVIIQQFDLKFAVTELLRDAHAGLLTRCPG